MSDERDNTAYNLSDEVLIRAAIKGKPEDMREWLDSLEDHELEDWFLIASRPQGTNSGVELTEVMFKAIVLFAFELDTMDIAITQEKASEIAKRFLVNILLYKGEKNGLYIIKGKLGLVTTPDITLTELGREVAKILTENDQKGNTPS